MKSPLLKSKEFNFQLIDMILVNRVIRFLVTLLENFVADIYSLNNLTQYIILIIFLLKIYRLEELSFMLTHVYMYILKRR